MKKILLIILNFVNLTVFANFTTLSAQQVQDKINQGVAIIDVRMQDEWDKYGIIPNSHKITFFDKNGKYDVQKWLQKLSIVVKNKKTPFILVCAHANRTKTIGNFLNKKTNYKNIFELAEGINNGWLKKGLATTKIPINNNKPWYKFW